VFCEAVMSFPHSESYCFHEFQSGHFIAFFDGVRETKGQGRERMTCSNRPESDSSLMVSPLPCQLPRCPLIATNLFLVDFITI